ncbi:phosphotransferase enzyme family protein [Hirsutella rhossiliensis]|uniref:Phosphotransferase enzyme family domain-containing protein n=1 Tax=Hirsutella rhossiliensis TaxID=111463 RepID=A0A9P8SCX9_9HYPO|nr:phosphotransferase enzyme family domain-containing protein [Hirsutella rhossiliensis]KAH0958128.1 phosphotransferase enzyme family domain-containing protein [Hirsutella rhossiliensis]
MHAKTTSVWTYENGAPEEFSLTRLCDVVDAHFGVKCELVKLAEGGYHKVYDIIEAGDGVHPGKSLNAVARVASPAFPRDKLKSEVATLRYIASHTSVPVPSVSVWNADASNPVGAEYMIMQKIPGVPAFDNWQTLPVDIKESVVVQVAEHLAALFSIRFDKAGSLYCVPSASKSSSSSVSSTASDGYEVGPIVTGPFFHSLDGILDYPTTDLHTLPSSSSTRLHSLRGPFTGAGDYLAHHLRALLFKCTEFPKETMRLLDDEDKPKEEPDNEQKRETLQRAERALRKGIQLCAVYPGDASVYPGGPSTPEQPFTLRLDDFRLVNILIDEYTGKVNGYIDFEGTSTAPLWYAATVPQWIPDPDGDTASWYGGSPADQRRLWGAFHATMARCDAEWRKAYQGGKPFRAWADHLELGVEAWGSEDVERWVDARLAWASEEGRRGMAMPESDD